MIPRWLPRVAFALALGGVAVSACLTYAHYTSPAVLACSDKGFVNCAQVTTSAQSSFLGMPVAVLGLGWWLVMAVLQSPWAWRSPSPRLHRARLALSLLGVAFVLWLIYAEFVIIGAICLWCSVVHALTFAEFVLVMLYGLDVARTGTQTETDADQLSSAG